MGEERGEGGSCDPRDLWTRKHAIAQLVKALARRARALHLSSIVRRPLRQTLRSAISADDTGALHPLETTPEAHLRSFATTRHFPSRGHRGWCRRGRSRAARRPGAARLCCAAVEVALCG